MSTANPIIAAFEACEPRVLMSSTPTLSSLQSSAEAIALAATADVTLSGNIDGVNDIYQFTASASGYVKLNLQATGGGLDTLLQVYNSSGKLCASNDNSNRTTNSYINLSVKDGQTYYVVASSAKGTTGSYTLELTGNPTDDIGNTFSAAKSVSINSRGAGSRSGTINYSADADMISLVSDKTGTMTVSLATRTALATTVSVYNAAGQLVSTQSVGGGAANSLTIDVAKGQVYYVRVGSADGSTGQYTMNVQTQFVGQSVEVATTGTTSIGNTLGANGSDVYVFVVPATGKYTLTLLSLGSADTQVQVFNSNGTLKSQSSLNAAGNDSQITLSLSAGQMYYVAANAVNGTSGQYQLSWTAMPVDDVGNLTSNAKAVVVSSSGKLITNGTINYFDDEDVFAVVADKTGVMTVSLDSTQLQGQLSAFDSANTMLGADGTTSLSFLVEKGQVYYVQASALTGASGNYRLNITTSFVGESVSLDTTGTASESGTLSVNGSDVYKFTALATGYVDLSMASYGSNVNTMLLVYNSSSRQIAGNDNATRSTSNSAVSLYVRAGETYYVAANSTQNTSGAYQLTMSSRPTDDVSNTTVNARGIRLSSAAAGSASGTINYYNDTDVFSLTANMTGTMTVTMTSNNSAFTSKMTVLNSSGTTVTTASGTNGTTTTVTFSVTSGATYYLCATTADGLTGSYRLAVSTAETVTPDPIDTTELPATPTPGSTVTGKVIQTSSGLQLLVVGTNSADTVTVSQTSAGLTLTTSSGTLMFSGTFASVVVYGFAGADTLRLDSTVTAAAWIYGGDGNDNLYNAGTGSSVIYGGLGDDTIVTIGGGKASVYGGDGIDSIWVDSADSVKDASTVENDFAAIHVISSFYQPYTTNTSSSLYVSTTIAGQNLQDPTVNSYSGGYKNYSSYSLFSGTPTYNDVSQGAVGDCYYMAALASLAQSDPEVIQQAVTALGDGTYAVRFYQNGKSVYLRVDADLPVFATASSSLAYAKLGAQGELWTAIMEKAYAYFRKGANSYSSLDSGWMDEVYSAVANCSTSSVSTRTSASSMYNTLLNALNSGRAVTAGSVGSPANPIIGGHAYMIKSVQTDSTGQLTVTVYNPWGDDGKTWDSNYGDGLLTITLTQFLSSFSTVMIAAA